MYFSISTYVHVFFDRVTPQMVGRKKGVNMESFVLVDAAEMMMTMQLKRRLNNNVNRLLPITIRDHQPPTYHLAVSSCGGGREPEAEVEIESKSMFLRWRILFDSTCMNNPLVTHLFYIVQCVSAALHSLYKLSMCLCYSLVPFQHYLPTFPIKSKPFMFITIIT